MVNKIKKYIMVECSVEREKKISFYFIDYDLFRKIMYTHCDLYVHSYNIYKPNSDVYMSTRYNITDSIAYRACKEYTYNE